MTNNQPNTRFSRRKPWKIRTLQVPSDPQFAPVQNSSLPTTRSIHIATGKLGRLKNLLLSSRSNQTIASASMSVSASIQAELPQTLHKVFCIIECCSLSPVFNVATRFTKRSNSNCTGPSRGTRNGFHIYVESCSC